MTKILAEYSSRSHPDKKYHIFEAKNGLLYCDCWGWKRTRKCAHLGHYRGVVLPALEKNKQVNVYEDGDIVVAIEAAIASLK